MNISVYNPLSESKDTELPHKLKYLMKGLINIKNNGNKCFLWCHFRHLNPIKPHIEIVPKADKIMINDLDCKGIKFPVSKKDLSKIENKNNNFLNVFSYENDLTYPVYISNEKFKNCMDLLLISNENKSHYVYIKDFSRFMCNRTKKKKKKNFCKCCLQCFSSERFFIKHKETCLKIDDKGNVKLKIGSVEFKNDFI